MRQLQILRVLSQMGRTKTKPSSSKDRSAAKSCRFFQLPYPLILDILSRLPINNLLHCRCVCKSLLCSISDPEFASLHFSRSPPCILFKCSLDPRYPDRLQLANVVANDDDDANFQVSKLNLTHKTNIPVSNISDMSVCNGLICLVGSITDDNYNFYLCNPILGEFITIQPPYNDKVRRRGEYFGLGYSSLTNQFKILQSYHKNVNWNEQLPCLVETTILVELARSDERAEIYTVGTGTWRRLGNVPIDYVSSPFNAFLNGALHWSIVIPRGGELIHTFDFDAEQFGTVPPPDHFRDLDEESEQHAIAGVLGGCLFVAHVAADSTQFDIWVMKEYGVKESWTKQFVIENLYPSTDNGLGFGDYELMVVLSNGEILILLQDKEVVCYNQQTKRYREFYKTRSMDECLEAIAYTPCFLSLNNVAKGEERISRYYTVIV